MGFTRTIEVVFKRFLPAPFTIAVLLTLLTLVLALLTTNPPAEGSHILQLLSYWENGIWNKDLLVFGYQMMLILVLGHILVLSGPMNRLIQRLTSLVNNTSQAVILVSVSTLIVSFFNWGLGLIFGAIMARKVAEASQERGFSINYPLVGAAGYCGLMIWHGGISGSAPLKVAESGHLQQIMAGISDPGLLAQLPDTIPGSATIFSWWNLLLFGILLILIPWVFYRLSKKAESTPVNLTPYAPKSSSAAPDGAAERLDDSPWFGRGVGLLMLLTFIVQYGDKLLGLTLTPNMLNFFMLGMALLLHGSFRSFLAAVEEAIKGAAGILIQFPLYFGIMGIMAESGMVQQIADFFVSIANETTLPIYTFFSAGLVNIFVPSGGGQWAVQGPIVIESAMQLGVPLPKAVMALSYGDQITNMLQPFWALPLLGITKLKAKEILPYTLIIMLVGSAVFICGLLLL
ncbi:short-chain fatty acid transporter [Gilvibacter sp.]|uniref:short-chain fatty acid transporter n=1 Tax=Gilvibacter sp. TaxID=2729997 RepID=UPI003F49EFAE